MFSNYIVNQFKSTLLKETQRCISWRKSSFELSSEFINSFKKKSSPFENNGLAELVYKRTYAREKETIVDTLGRVVSGTIKMLDAHAQMTPDVSKEYRDAGFQQALAQEIFEAMHAFKFLPPGRGLWAMGSRITDETHLFAALNNCGFVSTKDLQKDPIAPFAFLMDASMLGVGVGFDTMGAGSIYILTQNTWKPSFEFVIPDSREGWVEGLRLLLLHFFVPGHALPKFNYSLIRPAGMPIKGFGGVSSGYVPLKYAFDMIEITLEKSRGRPISVTNIVDIMNVIGKCVVSGNVRRSAEVAFGSADSEEFLDLKNYEKNPERKDFGWSSNNSIIGKLGMDYKPIAERIITNGEPGIYWLDNARNFSRMNGVVDHRDHLASGSNPCVDANTIIFTLDGPRRVRNLIGEKFKVFVDNRSYTCKKGFFSTGIKNIFTLKTKEGHSLNVTENHKILVKPSDYSEPVWVEAKDLRKGNRLVLNNTSKICFTDKYNIKNKGWVGNGSFLDGWLVAMLSYAGVRLKADSFAAIQIKKQDSELINLVAGVLERSHVSFDMVKKRDIVRFSSQHLTNLWLDYGVSPFQVPSFDILCDTSSQFQSGYICGMFDVAGTIDGDVKSNGYLTVSFDQEALAKNMQTMLLYRGVHSSIAKKKLPTQKDYYQEDGIIHEVDIETVKFVLTIKTEFIQFLDHANVFLRRSTNPVFIKRFPVRKSNYASPTFEVVFESLTFSHEAAVYDCTVEEIHRFGANGIVVHNCLEQTLESYELCCLVETFPVKHTNLKDYLRTLELALLYAKIVTLGPTHWKKTNEVMKRNRRIGVSMTGITQFISQRSLAELHSWCVNGYSRLTYHDRVISSQLAVDTSIKLSSVKPSGTVSLLANTTPGIHYPISQYYIRRVRIPSNSPLVKPLIDAGYHVEDALDGMEGTTKVVEFPVSVSDKNIPAVSEVSMWEQLSLAAFMQKYWADNSVSATVTFNPDNVSTSELARAIDVFQYQLKGISFLPDVPSGAYPQMPYEKIDQSTYSELISKIKPVYWGGESENFVEVKTHAFCDNDTCALP